MNFVGKIVQLPQRPPPTRGSSSEASWLQIYRGRLTGFWGRLLNRLGVPGAVRNAHIKDALTGQEITVQVGELFTRISVNGRDYYFNRASGKFDGTGMGCS